jgi:hypothetical protein
MFLYARNSQTLNSIMFTSPLLYIPNLTHIGKPGRKVRMEKHLHPQLKYGFDPTDFREYHACSTFCKYLLREISQKS